METKKQNCNWFTWHVLPTPKDYPIQSVVEFVVLITSLVALLFVYGSVNHVNVIDEELNIAYLDKLRYSPNHSVDNIDSLNEYKKATVGLYLPMTVQEQLKEHHSNIEVNVIGYSWKSNQSLKNSYDISIRSVKTYDSLIFAKFPESAENLTKYTYYYGQKLKIRNKFARMFLSTSSIIDTIPNKLICKIESL